MTQLVHFPVRYSDACGVLVPARSYRATVARRGRRYGTARTWLGLLVVTGRCRSWPRRYSLAMEAYRVFPRFEHPRQYRRLTAGEFEGLEKGEVRTGGPLCAGHLGSTLWYAGDGSDGEKLLNLPVDDFVPANEIGIVARAASPAIRPRLMRVKESCESTV